jgi:heme/copper-type cytochrome/quinol oxidase subunit 3
MNAIPYTVERRPDTGVNNVKLGTWLFLASEAMLFAGLFSAYFMLRAGAVVLWSPLSEHAGQALASTVVLLAGTAAFGASIRAARQRLAGAGSEAALPFVLWLLASAVLALAFCVHEAGEHAALFARGRGPASSTQMASFFLLTGVHMLHVAAGAVLNLRLLLTRASTWTAAGSGVVNRLEAAALYWYFVDAVWLVLAVLFYVV